MMNTEFTIKYIKYTAEMWKKKRKEVFSYDHPNVDYLFITIHMENGEEQYLAYSMSERNNGKDGLLYYGDEFPEAIFTIMQ